MGRPRELWSIAPCAACVAERPAPAAAPTVPVRPPAAASEALVVCGERELARGDGVGRVKGGGQGLLRSEGFCRDQLPVLDAFAESAVSEPLPVLDETIAP